MVNSRLRRIPARQRPQLRNVECLQQTKTELLGLAIGADVFLDQLPEARHRALRRQITECGRLERRRHQGDNACSRTKSRHGGRPATESFGRPAGYGDELPSLDAQRAFSDRRDEERVIPRPDSGFAEPEQINSEDPPARGRTPQRARSNPRPGGGARGAAPVRTEVLLPGAEPPP